MRDSQHRNQIATEVLRSYIPLTGKREHSLD